MRIEVIVKTPTLVRSIKGVGKKIHLKKLMFFLDYSVIIAPNTIAKTKTMDFISLMPDYCLGMENFGVTIFQFNLIISNL